MKLTFICNYIERLILSKKWLRRFSFCFHIIEKDNFSTLEEQELDSIKTNKIIIINAWDIRCPNSLKLKEQTVKRFLQPASCYLKEANNFINHLKKSCNSIVGVHARRGDYKTYLGGKHFHSWENYQNWVLEVKIVLEKKGYKKIGFILCTDESPSPCILDDKSILFTQTNNFIIDLYTLTLCDYNIGPPSSFGTWVSWYGKVPRLVLEQDTKVISIDQFQVSEYC